MKKLPIGIQTFSDIREEDYVYIDKTASALRLIEEGRYYFLSRPRRFGKSLFLSTLKSIFDNRKELFEGLCIHDRYAWETKYPVIRITFSDGIGKNVEEFRKLTKEMLGYCQKELDLPCEADLTLPGCFKYLIHAAHEKYDQKVVILIDEYDKPILDNLETPEVARAIREELKSFYSVIKGADEYIKLVFITGVSKFSKVSLFSGLNNLQDITLDPRYATICGYTQSDIETHFHDRFAQYNVNLEQVRIWYNGYKWLGEGLYNPFGFLNFLANGGIYENYWFGSATPTFLLKLIEKNHYYLPEFENIVTDRSMLDSFDVDHIELEILMWQTGYLTITEATQGFSGMEYRLAIPNKEVRVSLMRHIVDLITKSRGTIQRRNQLYEALSTANLEALEAAIHRLFAAIDYHNFTAVKLYEYEGYYASVLYSYLASLGTELHTEEPTNKGRIDLTMRVPSKTTGELITYVCEFKVVEKAGEVNAALEQIKARGYAEKFDGEVWLVGIEFGKAERNVVGFAGEKISPPR